MIQLENVHHMKRGEDKKRYLIDRQWPRGVIRFIPHREPAGGKRRALAPILWRPKLAPGAVLSEWFRENPDKERRFRALYFGELLEKEVQWRLFAREAVKNGATLLYHDDGFSLTAARAFRDFIERRPKAVKKVTGRPR